MLQLKESNREAAMKHLSGIFIYLVNPARREIIHRLCVSDCSHSQLTNHIEPRLVEHPQFEKILKEVAIFHHPKVVMTYVVTFMY